MVVGFPPGGPNDIAARVVSQKLGDLLGEKVVIENRPGAAGNIGTELVARAAPDGYTLLMGSAGPQAINPALYPNLPFDMLRDLAPVSLVAQIPSGLAVNPAVPAATVAELIALARKQPGKLHYGSGGSGTTLHLSGALFALAAGVNLTHVPYKGTAPAITDVAGGQVEMIFAAIPSVLPLVNAGKLRLLAVTTRARSPAVPNAPTVAEAGLPDYEVTPWFGVFTASGVPKPVLRRLNEEVRKAVASAEVRESFAKQGLEPATNSPEEFEALLRAEIAKWSRVVKETGVTVN
jgi:tripartite-type tricarboxylate transporter receptor subunit TctC